MRDACVADLVAKGGIEWGMQHGARLGMSVQTPGGDHPPGVSGMILPISIAWLAGTS